MRSTTRLSSSTLCSKISAKSKGRTYLTAHTCCYPLTLVRLRALHDSTTHTRDKLMTVATSQSNKLAMGLSAVSSFPTFFSLIFHPSFFFDCIASAFDEQRLQSARLH